MAPGESRMLDITLPHILKPGDRALAEGFYLHDHQRATPSPRYRITLRWNLISLLLAGRKHLVTPAGNEFFEPVTCLVFRQGR